MSKHFPLHNYLTKKRIVYYSNYYAPIEITTVRTRTTNPITAARPDTLTKP